jgi:ADP-heptose:LPS heptosyltransferase
MTDRIAALRALPGLLRAKKPRECEPKTLLLFRIDAIGDYVVFRNFIPKLLAQYGGYEVTLCGNPAWKGFADFLDSGHFAAHIWIDWNRFWADAAYRAVKLGEIGSRGYEVLLQPTYSRNPFAEFIVNAFSAKEKIASSGEDTALAKWFKRASNRMYSKIVPASRGELFEFYRNREFCEGLTGKKANVRLSIEKTAPPNPRIEGDYAVIFPGAGFEFRCWSAQNFASVASHLSKKHGLAVAVAGSPADSPRAREIMRGAPGARVFDYTGKTSLPELAGLIAGAKLLVSTESCAPHIAAAVGTKFVTVSTRFHLARWHPYPKELSPGSEDACACNPGESIGAVSPARVAEAADRLL